MVNGYRGFEPRTLDSHDRTLTTAPPPPLVTGLSLVNDDGRMKTKSASVCGSATIYFVADSEKKLRQLVEEFRLVCRRKNLRVNGNKSRVMKCTREYRWEKN